ncbi:hypothetical protein GYM62_16150 [Algoriphagus sp. NBT04N3]|uniref:hypothetical protein n=1 Tax=Algoriphagus sp. NBT04N3 TaxID=2705473 RepID=UPI001C626828|nr:hypothetical protein [Algoriphagus sp. NBT04N3]QYH40248.1 hypothetical protein GYM62_16150 [Algoriphagus sp. NBT04N3]
MIKSFKEKISKHPLRKKVLRVLMIVFLALIFLEFLIYFGSNLLLVNWTRTKLNEATGGVYEVDFNRLNFSLLRRGVFLNGIIMRPVSLENAGEDQVLFDFTLDELALKNIWYDWSEKIFIIGNIKLDNPNLSLELSESTISNAKEKDSLKVSQVKRLENEIKKSIQRIPFGGIFINRLEIDHADLFFLNFLSQKSINAKNTRLIIEDIDWTSSEEWKTPFNAKGFEFDLDQVEFLLPDGIHTIYADEVFVTSLENQIQIEKFQLRSDKSIESFAYYDMDLDQLRVGNVELNKAFMESDLEIDEIILNSPDFKVIRSDNPKKNQNQNGDLNDLISGLLKSFYVKELSINKGKFLTYHLEDSLENRIEVSDLNFKMVKFYLGDDQTRKKNQFFYGEDASMELGDLTLYLSDQVHLIKGEKVMASSFLDRIQVQGFEIKPRDSTILTKRPHQLIDIRLNELLFSEANLKKLYNQGVLDVEKLEIISPKVQVTDLEADSGIEERKGRGASLLMGYLNELNIGEFDLRQGEVQFQNQSGIRSDDIGFDQFSLFLENVRFSPDTAMQLRDILLADEMILSLDKYQLKLRDNLHIFSADKIIIDSKKSLIDVQNFSLKPESRTNIQSVLDTYKKTVAVDLKVPSFRVEGVDIKKALLDQELYIKQILVPRPELTYTKYRDRSQKREANQLDSAEGIRELLESYFAKVSIDSVSFQEGKFNFSDLSGRREISFVEEDLSLTLKGFYMDNLGNYDESKTFFSDEIVLNLADYSFSLARGDYDVTTSNLVFNTKNRTLVIDTLRLMPGDNLRSKLSLSLILPKVSFEGIDLEDFLFDNRLDLDKLNVVGSTISLEINPAIESKNSPINPRVRRSLDFIKVGEISALNSDFRLNYIQGQTDLQSIQTSFDITVADFFLDEQANREMDLSGLFKQISIGINDFSFALPDSVHSVRLSNLTFDTEQDETILSGIEILPLKPLNLTNGPVFQGKIQEIGLRNNELEQIQESGIFDLTQLRILKPDFKIFLDSISTQIKNENLKEFKVKDGLVNSIMLQNINLNQGNFEFFSKSKNPLNGLAFKDVDFSLKKLNLDLLNLEENISPEVLFKKQLEFSLKDYNYYLPDSMELFSIGSFSYSDENLVFEKVRFRPAMGRYNYLRKKGFQTDAIDLYLDRIEVEGLNFERIFTNQGYQAKKLNLDGMRLDVFRDKRLPARPNAYKPMPQDLLRNASIRALVDSIHLRNGLIRYQEFTPGAQLPGQVSFHNMNASIVPFAMSLEGERHPIDSFKVIATTDLMGEGKVEMNSTYYFSAGSPINLSFKMGEMPLEYVNDILSKGAFVKARSGKVNSADWYFRLTDEEAIGKMTFLYEGLKVDLLDSLTLEKGTGKVAFESFLANTLIKNNNPRRLLGNIVSSDIYFKRDKSKFIFNTWWKATLTGLKGSMGLGQPQMPVRRKEEEE